jgi:hemerythrin-like domain-containing protein
MTPQEIAAGTIRQEHRALGAVIEVLQRLLRDIAAEHIEPDFRLLSTALYYIDDFPERCHHPREERYLFTALRARSPEFDPLLDDLESEHVTSAHTLARLHRVLVHYQADAPGALAALRAGVDAYAAMLSAHMRKEEAVLPVGSYQENYCVTLSLPSQLGSKGVLRVFTPPLAPDEARALEASAAALREALKSIDS